jgi:mRNA-degrading endonuclease RelE of RelBE toxin-antitoxin system
MNWNLLVTGPAQKQLRRIPERDRERVKAALLAIEDEPFSGDLVRLRAQPAATLPICCSLTPALSIPARE